MKETVQPLQITPTGKVFLKSEQTVFCTLALIRQRLLIRDKVENVDLGKELGLKIPEKVARGPRNPFSFLLRLF